MRPLGSLALCLVILTCGWPLAAETYSYISGVILDPSRATVPGASLTVLNEETGFRRTTVSQPDGEYTISPLAPGLYKITVRKPGFRTMVRFDVKVEADRPARIDFSLLIGSVQDTVTVEGAAPLLNDQDASVETLIGREASDELPLNGNTLLSLLEFTPGVVVTPATRGEAGQFTVNGQRPNTNYFMVDGISANSGVSGGGTVEQSTGGTLPSMTAFGSLDSTASLDAVQETRVQTSTSVSEFGRLPGAQVSLSTRSGSNNFHGSAKYAFRNQDLDANDWFANAQGAERARLRLQDSAGDLGGPIKRNRTFFFVNYEHLQLVQPFVSREAVPSNAARVGAPAWAQPLLNSWPVPNGPDLGSGLAMWTGGISRPSSLNGGAVRVDQGITSRLTAFGRYSDSASSTDFGTTSANLLHLRTQSLTGGVDFRAGPGLLFDLRANGSNATANSVWLPAGSSSLTPCAFQSVIQPVAGTSAGCDYLVRVQISGVGEVAAGSEGRRSQSQVQVVEETAWDHAKHSVRAGVDYRRLAPSREDASPSISILANQLSDLTNLSQAWSANTAAQNISSTVSEVGLYAQDTWRATQRLTVVFGARWELSPAPQSKGLLTFFNPATQLATQTAGAVWPARYGNVGPRLGLAYRVGARTVLRAGGGLYYDSSLSLATDLVNEGPLNVDHYGSGQYGLFAALLNWGYEPNLKLPSVVEWNASVEHALSSRDVVSATYAGSEGRDLIRHETGGPGSSNLIWLVLATNHGASDYQSLQLQYRRRLERGIEALVSYAWSHSLDNSSSDGGLYWAGSGLSPGSDWASSDFDVRQTLTAGFSYDVPASKDWLKGWSVEGLVRARTGFPISVMSAEQYSGINFENVFRPNLVSGQPVWLRDPNAPGGKRINPAAFVATPSGVQGNLGRNALTGFGMNQVDLALRREFFVGEQRTVQFKIEAYNAFNHPNFADPVRYLTSPLFGVSGSMLNLMLGTGSPGSGLTPMFQAGGARVVQASVRFRF